MPFKIINGVRTWVPDNQGGAVNLPVNVQADSAGADLGAFNQEIENLNFANPLADSGQVVSGQPDNTGLGAFPGGGVTPEVLVDQTLGGIKPLEPAFKNIGPGGLDPAYQQDVEGRLSARQDARQTAQSFANVDKFIEENPAVAAIDTANAQTQAGEQLVAGAQRIFDPVLGDYRVQTPQDRAREAGYNLEDAQARRTASLRGTQRPEDVEGFRGFDLSGAFPPGLEYKPPAQDFVSGADQGLSTTTANTALGAAQGGEAIAGNVQQNVGQQVVTTPDVKGNGFFDNAAPVQAYVPLREGEQGPVLTPEVAREDAPFQESGQLPVESRATSTPATRTQTQPAPIQQADGQLPDYLSQGKDQVVRNLQDPLLESRPFDARRRDLVDPGAKPDLEVPGALSNVLNKAVSGVSGAVGNLFDSMANMSPEQSDRLANAFFQAAAGSSLPGSIPHAIGTAGMGFIESKQKAEEQAYQRALEGRKETRAEKATALAERAQSFKEFIDVNKQTTDEEQFNKTYEFAMDKFYDGHEHAKELLALQNKYKSGQIGLKAAIDAQANMLDIKPGEYTKIEHIVTSESADLVERALQEAEASSDPQVQGKAEQLREMMQQFKEKGEFARPAEVRIVLSEASPELQAEFAQRYTDMQRAYAPNKDIAGGQRYMKNAQFGRGFGGFPSEGQKEVVKKMEAVPLADLVTGAGSQDINDVVKYTQELFDIGYDEAVALVESKQPKKAK